MKRASPPTLYLIMGPSGAGKSVYGHLFVPKDISILDADKEALKIQRTQSCDIDTAYYLAGCLTEEKINNAIIEKKSIAVETPFANKVGKILLEKFSKINYQIKGVFFGLNSLEESIARINQRIMRGGNVVDPENAERNFYNSTRNIALYKDYFDEIMFLSVDKDRRIIKEAVYENDYFKILADSPSNWINEVKKAFIEKYKEHSPVSIDEVLKQIRKNHFSIDELPIKEFQKLNIDINRIDPKDIDKLLKGGRTDPYQCLLSKGGEQFLIKLSFSLQRNPDNTVSLLCSPNERERGMKR